MRRTVLLLAMLVVAAAAVAGFALWREPHPVSAKVESTPPRAAPGREEALPPPVVAQPQQGGRQAGEPVGRPQAEPASAGPVLAELERRLRGSPAVRACLADAPRTGTLEYELVSATSGITFLRGGDLRDTPVRPCVEDELSTLIENLAASPAAERNVHKVTLEARR